MEKDVYINLDFFILTEDLTTDHIKKGMEMEIGNYRSIVAVNRLPFYEAKITTESELVIGKIIRILKPEESVHIKEKYAM